MTHPDPDAATGSHTLDMERLRAVTHAIKQEGDLAEFLHASDAKPCPFFEDGCCIYKQPFYAACLAECEEFRATECEDGKTVEAPRSPDPSPSRFRALIAEMVETHDTKNRDYADSATDPLRNFRRCEDVGIPAYLGCFVRMGDKFMRAENLLKRLHAGGDGPAVASESVIDTLKDLAVYALIEIELIEQYLATMQP